MPIDATVTPLLDLQAVNKTQGALAQALAEAGQKGGAQFQDAMADSLRKIEDTTKKAFNLERAESALEGLKIVAGAAGDAFGDLAGEIGKGALLSVDLAEGGFKIGAAFGPLGGVIGAATGALVGATSAIWDFATGAEATAAAVASLSAQQALWKQLEESSKKAGETMEASRQRILDLRDSLLYLDEGAVKTKEDVAFLGQDLSKLAPDELVTALQKSTTVLTEIGEGLGNIKGDIEKATSAEKLAELEERLRALVSLKSEYEASAKQIRDLYDATLIKTGGTKRDTAAVVEATEAISALTEEWEGLLASGFYSRAGAQSSSGIELPRLPEIDPRSGEELLRAIGLVPETFDSATELLKGEITNMFRETWGEINLPAVTAEQFSEAPELTTFLSGFEEGLWHVADVAAETLGGIAADSASEFFSRIAEGQKILSNDGAWKQIAAKGLQSTGSQLIGEGVRAEFEAAIMAAKSGGLNPLWIPTAAAGAAAIAGGLAMGGTGAFLGRRANKGGAAPSGGGLSGGGLDGGPRLSGVDGGTQTQTPSVIYLGGAPGSTTIYAENSESTGRRAKAAAGRMFNDFSSEARMQSGELG